MCSFIFFFIRNYFGKSCDTSNKLKINWSKHWNHSRAKYFIAYSRIRGSYYSIYLRSLLDETDSWSVSPKKRRFFCTETRSGAEEASSSSVPVVKISLSGILGFLSTGCKVIDASLFMISTKYSRARRLFLRITITPAYSKYRFIERCNFANRRRILQECDRLKRIAVMIYYSVVICNFHS